MDFRLFMKKYGVLLLLIPAAAIFYVIGSRSNEPAQKNELMTASPLQHVEEEKPMEREEEGKLKTIYVDVKGAVKKPGVYQLEPSSRVFDAVEKAGGLDQKADEKRINFAKKLVDGMVVYIPSVGEKMETTAAFFENTAEGQNLSTPSNESKQLININTAAKEELQNLTGIGPSKAEAIIAYREENGPFQKPEDLLEVSGIGEKTFEKIKNEITVDGN